MNIFNTDYFNVDFNNDINLLTTHKEIDLQINNVLDNQRSLNIVQDNKLLDETIKLINKFIINKSTFIILGTGGSNLGGKALINILQGNEKNKIIFFDNIDPINFKNSILKFDLNKIGFIIISKSGSTPETLSQFSCIIEIFDKKKQLHNLFSNSLIITEDKPSPLFNISKNNNCKFLKHDNDIGGRFSVFSNVGMVPAIIAGLDVKKIYAGASDVILKKKEYKFINLGKFFRFQKINPNINNSVIMTYSDSLFYFGKWYLQLWAESLGKDNKGITPIHSYGTTDQHSQLQLYLDGPKDKFFTFITTDHSNKGLKLHNETMKKNNLNYLINKTMGDLMQAEQRATIDTFKKHNMIFREINIYPINEFSIGQLMALSIMETIATCLYFEVNPFNQPAVEEGKILTKKFLL
tara:strand:+ start:524 stop:1750 length:1227 start_codon:yes stop_codon:yes gene_type:complete